MKQKINKLIKKYFSSYLVFYLFSLLFLALLVTRFYHLETLNVFGFDQVDNAWAVKNIVIDKEFPLIGMQAKGNTGFFIGPYYYYYLVPFYIAFGLDPIASGFVAGFTAIISFVVTYVVIRNIFNEKVALIAGFITVFSSYIIGLDRTQWPVNFIVPLSFLFLYSLYRICLKDSKYFLLLTTVFGFSLHIHFTSIFYIGFFILTVPFIPWNKKTLKYIMYSIPILLFFVYPIVLNYISTKSAGNASNYLSSTFHGFHLRRFIQIMGDGFIEFNAILRIPYALIASLTVFSLFIFLLLKKRVKKNILLVYLVVIWILVPWITFSTYSGEITNYYFGIGRPVAIIVISYILFKLLVLNNKVLRYGVLVLLVVYALVNLRAFFQTRPVSLTTHRETVLKKIANDEKVEFIHGDPQSYIYYYLTEVRDEGK